MKHNSFFSILFLAMLLLSSQTGLASGQTAISTKGTQAKEKMMTTGAGSETSGMNSPTIPATRNEEPVRKLHMIKTEELAHIHHFHKERVKKLKKHHKKCWRLSKILLILCHIALLVIAYMHVTPH